MKRLSRLVAITLAPLVTLLYFPLPAWGAPSSTAIIHSPIANAQSGYRIPVMATITDPTGVESARTYFKALEAPDYAFVAMAPSPDGTFVGTLPAPAQGVQAVDYLILVRNGANRVVTSQNFRIAVEDSDAVEAGSGPMPVYTELAKAPEGLPGFTGNIALHKVEPEAKFGLVAGLYSSAATGGGASADEGGDTTSGGTVVASSTNWEMIGVVGGSAAVAVALAVAAGGGGGGGDGGGGGSEGGGGGNLDQPSTCYLKVHNVISSAGSMCELATVQFTTNVPCIRSSFPHIPDDWEISATPSLSCPGGYQALCVLNLTDYDQGDSVGTWTDHRLFFYGFHGIYASIPSDSCSALGGSLQ